MTLRSIDGGQANPAQANPAQKHQTDPRAPQMPWLSVYLTVKDADASIDFYTRAFGFTAGTVVRSETGVPQHVEMQYRGEIPVMFSPEGTEGCATQSPATLGITLPVSFYLYHDDVDALAAQAKAAGARVEAEPQDMFWGDRMAAFVCPNGYRWSFATHTGQDTGPLPGAA